MLVDMNGHRITPLVAALTLAAVPSAFGATPPKGSHGQETDRARTAQVRVQTLCGSGTIVLSRHSAAVIVPRGSHGQETDQPRRTEFALDLKCVDAHRSAVKPTAPRGSHGQETDQHGAHR
jgi:hypothetical protein